LVLFGLSINDLQSTSVVYLIVNSYLHDGLTVVENLVRAPASAKRENGIFFRNDL